MRNTIVDAAPRRRGARQAGKTHLRSANPLAWATVVAFGLTLDAHPTSSRFLSKRFDTEGKSVTKPICSRLLHKTPDTYRPRSIIGLAVGFTCSLTTHAAIFVPACELRRQDLDADEQYRTSSFWHMPTTAILNNISCRPAPQGLIPHAALSAVVCKEDTEPLQLTTAGCYQDGFPTTRL